MTSADHIHHDVAEAWLECWDGLIASSPVTQGALVRFVLRSGGTTTEAITVMRDLHESPRHEFWEDTLGYDQVDLRGVVGHRQVTDAYLASTALVAGMVAGAASNVDLDLLRHGGMHRIFGGIRAPPRAERSCAPSPLGTCCSWGRCRADCWPPWPVTPRCWAGPIRSAPTRPRAPPVAGAPTPTWGGPRTRRS